MRLILLLVPAIFVFVGTYDVFAGPVTRENGIYVVVEEFESTGHTDYWHTQINQIAYSTEEIYPEKTKYRFEPLTGGFTSSNMPLIPFIFANNKSAFEYYRDSSLDRLYTEGKPSYFVESVNRLIEDLEDDSGGPLGEWTEKINIGDTNRSLVTSIEPCVVHFKANTFRAQGRELLIINYYSDPMAFSVDGTRNFRQRFDGVAVLSADKNTLYYAIYRYSGSVESWGRERDRYRGQKLYYLTSESTGKPVIAPRAIGNFAEFLKGYPLINSDKHITEISNGPVPDWLPYAVGMANESQLAAAVVGELRTNILPVMAIVMGVHIADGIYTLVANVGHDLGANINGYPDANWNPFDGDKPSLLNKYFYEPVARRPVELAAHLGWISPDDVNSSTTFVASLLRLPVDIKVLMTRNPHSIYGSMKGMGKGRSVVKALGDLHRNLEKARKVPALFNIISYGPFVEIGRDIVTSLSDLVLPESSASSPPASNGMSMSGAAALVGGALALCGGGYYLVSKANNSSDDDPLVSGIGGLSDVIVDSRDITITVFDHGRIDGDQIDLIINGDYVLENFVLDGPPGFPVDIRLRSGRNSIVVHADNEGIFAPNTATIIVSNVIAGEPEQIWKLGLGEDATFGISVARSSKPTVENRGFIPVYQVSYQMGSNLLAEFSLAPASGLWGNYLMRLNRKIQSGKVTLGLTSWRAVDEVRNTELYAAINFKDYPLLSGLIKSDLSFNHIIANRPGSARSIEQINETALTMRTRPVSLTEATVVSPELGTRNYLDSYGNWINDLIFAYSVQCYVKGQYGVDLSYKANFRTGETDRKLDLISSRAIVKTDIPFLGLIYAPQLEVSFVDQYYRDRSFLTQLHIRFGLKRKDFRLVQLLRI